LGVKKRHGIGAGSRDTLNAKSGSTGIGFEIEATYPGVFSDTPETNGAEFWEALKALLCIGERAYTTMT
jgi:hypothetical protein